MRRHPLGPWPATAVVVVVEALFLLAAIPLALRVPEIKAVPDLPESLGLDYSTLRTAAVAPLEAGFIRDVLGIDLEKGSTPGTSEEAGSGSASIGAPGALGAAARGASPTTFEHPLTNDDFADAVTIPRLPSTAVTDTSSATRERGEPGGCSAAGGTVWYRFRPSKDLGLTANTFGTDYATALAVFRGNRLSNLRLLRCEKDARGNSSTGFPARARRTYYFQVTGLVTGGELNFTLDAQGVTVLASRPDGGGESSGHSNSSSLSGNGRYVAFDSVASNLVGDDSNLSRDVFVRDVVTQRTERVSVSSSGAQGDGPSRWPSISADGRYVAFGSQARNFVEDLPVCTTSVWDDPTTQEPCYQVFVHDRVTGRTRLVSRSSSGEPGDGGSGSAAISADGRRVAFDSKASNLVRDRHQGCSDTFAPFRCLHVFVHDLETHKTARVSSSSSGAEGNDGSYSPSISRTGRYVAFESHATNLVDEHQVSYWNIFVHDRKRRITELISVHHKEGRGAKGHHFGPSRVSGDGRYVTFLSNSSELTADPPPNCEARHPWGAYNPPKPCLHIYVRDRIAGKTLHVSISSNGDPANHSSHNPDISGDGRFVTFGSYASNLVEGDSNGTACTVVNPFAVGCLDVFVRDLLTGTTSRVSIASSGREGSDGSFGSAISWDGSHIGFTSAASDLTRNDTNGARDVFVHRRPVRPGPR